MVKDLGSISPMKFFTFETVERGGQFGELRSYPGSYPGREFQYPPLRNCRGSSQRREETQSTPIDQKGRGTYSRVLDPYLSFKRDMTANGTFHNEQP